MISIRLPFTMGKIISRDPFTGEEEIDHPVLSIGSSSASLKPEVQQWLHRRRKYWSLGFDGTDYCLWVEAEQDKTLFLLRWL